MKKAIALFSILAMFSVTAFAQDPPKKADKNSTTARKAKFKGKKVVPKAKQTKQVPAVNPK